MHKMQIKKNQNSPKELRSIFLSCYGRTASEVLLLDNDGPAGGKGNGATSVENGKPPSGEGGVPPGAQDDVLLVPGTKGHASSQDRA